MIRAAGLAVVGGVLLAFNAMTWPKKQESAPPLQTVHMPINCRTITVWMNATGVVKRPEEAATEITACDNGYVEERTEFIGYHGIRRYNLAEGLVSHWKDEAYSKPDFPFSTVKAIPGTFTTERLEGMEYRMAEALHARAKQAGFENLARLTWETTLKPR